MCQTKVEFIMYSICKFGILEFNHNNVAINHPFPHILIQRNFKGGVVMKYFQQTLTIILLGWHEANSF